MMMVGAGLVCRDVTERMTDYLDGNMGWFAWLQFKLHLLMCKHCMEYLRQMQMTRETLATLPGSPVPEEVRSGLVDAFRSWHEELGTDPL